MLKKIVAVAMLLTSVIFLAETFAKETPFVKNANAVATKYFNMVYKGPVEAQWNKLRDSVKRVSERASRKKHQEEAMKTPPAPAPAKPAAPKPPPSATTPKSPKTGIQKSSSKKLWKDDKGAYNWKSKK